MPKRKRTRKRYGVRRKGRKRRKRSRKIVRILSGPTGLLGKQVIKKLRYSTTIQLVPGFAGVLAFHRFSANGMWDPDATGVGHQPITFDQMMNFYDHYYVYKSKITVHCASRGAGTNLGNAFVGIGIEDTISDAPTSPTHLIELGTYNWRPMQETSSPKGAVVIKKKFSTKKYWGRNLVSNTQYQGSASANPGQQTMFNIAYWGANPSSIPSAIDCTVYIDYWARFTEPKDIAQS